MIEVDEEGPVSREQFMDQDQAGSKKLDEASVLDTIFVSSLISRSAELAARTKRRIDISRGWASPWTPN